MDDVLMLEIAVGVIIAQLVFSALYRASAGTFLFRALVAFAVLVTGLAAARNTTAVAHAWDAFVELLVAIGRACVAVFL